MSEPTQDPATPVEATPLGPQPWTYSGNPATSQRDEVRFLVQDTDSGFQLLNDVEYDYLLAEWMPRYDNVHYVASVAAAVISRKFAGMVTVSTEGVSVNVGDLSDRYAKLAAELRATYIAHQIGGEVDISNLLIGTTLDPSIRPLNFGIGHMDNYAAGEQSYGGVIDPFLAAEQAVGRAR